MEIVEQQLVGYVTFLPDGSLDGAYLQVPPADHVDRMIVVDESTRASWVLYRANATRDGLELVPPPPPSMPTQDAYVNAIQEMLDTKATERKYFGIISACTYGDSTNATFKAEAQACIAWRDAVWAKAYDVLAQVQAGTLAQPTVADLLAMLPTMTWPT
jgi:hypothetical protein